MYINKTGWYIVSYIKDYKWKLEKYQNKKKSETDIQISIQWATLVKLHLLNVKLLR